MIQGKLAELVRFLTPKDSAKGASLKELPPELLCPDVLLIGAADGLVEIGRMEEEIACGAGEYFDVERWHTTHVAAVGRKPLGDYLPDLVSNGYCVRLTTRGRVEGARLAVEGGPAPTITHPAPPEPATKRRGRMPKDESAARRADMLANLRQHPSLKDDSAKLADIVGVSEATVRRWLEEEEEKYRKSRAARPDPDED